MNPGFYCYILRCSDGTFYTGWCKDPQRRAKQHNAGRGARYTRTRLPVALVYVETQPDQAVAMHREKTIKRMTHRRKQQLIEQASSSTPLD